MAQKTTVLKRKNKPTEEALVVDLAKNLNVSSDVVADVSRIISHPKIEILNDQPVSEDAFGVLPFVRAVSEVALSKSTQTPITIAINGKWGSGKTSVLKMIESQAKLLDIPCIWINAWGLENTENMIKSIGIAIENELARKNRSALSELPSRVPNELVLMPGYFKSQVDILLKNFNSKSNRVLVMLDDVDRAFPDQIVDVLRNLKLILEIENCVFILAMDMDVVAESIQTHYRSRHQSSLSFINMQEVTLNSNLNISSNVADENFGRSYLEKIVQIHAKMPNLTRKAVLSYLSKIGLSEPVRKIVEWAPDEEILNPRRLKQYVNKYTVYYNILTSIAPIPEAAPEEILQMVAISKDYPEIYEKMKDQLIDLEWIKKNIQFLEKTMKSKNSDFNLDNISNYIGRKSASNNKAMTQYIESSQFLG